MWVYMLATFLGGVSAAMLYKNVLHDEPHDQDDPRPKPDVHLAQKFV